jgi:fructosamine-3-kinase
MRDIAQHIAEASGEPFENPVARAVGGGCINQTLMLESGSRRWFVKLNNAHHLPMFEQEADGLSALAAVDALRVPRPLCWGESGGRAYLVLEYITLGGDRSGGAVAAGRGLAELHCCQGQAFGWHQDNIIGATLQPNGWLSSWIDFWRDRRLGHQLTLAAENGYGGRLQRQGERLLAALPSLLTHPCQPSLLHGDLWGGNLAYDETGAPVVFDPAVYYGDREADLAMTELFGGFSQEFYAAYQEAWPLDDGYAKRKTLYNLYHILNHLNLFGGGYLSQSERMIDALLAHCH